MLVWDALVYMLKYAQMGLRPSRSHASLCVPQVLQAPQDGDGVALVPLLHGVKRLRLGVREDARRLEQGGLIQAWRQRVQHLARAVQRPAGGHWTGQPHLRRPRSGSDA